MAYFVPVEQEPVDEPPYQALALCSVRRLQVGEDLPPALVRLFRYVHLLLLEWRVSNIHCC
jgi:hypothetical protein